MTNNKKESRRAFLKTAGIGTVVSLASLGSGAVPTAVAADRPRRKFQLALASYTTRKFDLDETLAMANRVGLEAICLKSFHLPLDATPEEIAAVVAKTKDAGITLYGGGVIGLKNQQQIDQAFDYAKAAGMTKIIGGPTPDMLPAIDKKVKQYDIQVCIHNHGPGDTHFPTPETAYDLVKQFDERIGFCHDIGHTKRVGGDPAAITKKCADRILDFHIKDVTEATKSGHATPCGRGVIDLPTMLRTLDEIDYQGYVAFEYEENADDPLPGLAESVGYVRGVLDSI
ncbi:MAG: sugar phosphate isomerase/epimerase family protein [Thermoguttaceae bacterium]